jgi:hypothetical protein
VGAKNWHGLGICGRFLNFGLRLRSPVRVPARSAPPIGSATGGSSPSQRHSRRRERKNLQIGHSLRTKDPVEPYKMGGPTVRARTERVSTDGCSIRGGSGPVRPSALSVAGNPIDRFQSNRMARGRMAATGSRAVVQRALSSTPEPIGCGPLLSKSLELRTGPHV